MPATTKDALIAVSEKEWAKLAALIGDVADDTALLRDDEDTSIKDVVGHRAHWIDLFLGWYEDGRAGKEVAFPAPGYNWSQLKAYNADLRARQADLGWDAARKMLEERHARLLSLLHSLDDGALYGGPMKGAKNNWTTGRWAEASGPSHYRSAAAYIRKRLKALKA